MVFSAAMGALALVSAMGLSLDDRMVAGSPIWFKPFKFAVSLAFYAPTLAWMLSLLTRARRTGWWAGTIVTAASTVEIVAIVAQVVRGKQSHFNYRTPFDEALYNVMSATIIILWMGALVIAVLMFRQRLPDRATAWAIRLGSLIALVGLALGLLMTSPTAEQKAAGSHGVSELIGAHSVGVPDGGPTMTLTGWSTTGGDLRVPHFVGMHALQLIPLFLLSLLALAPRYARLRDDRVRLRLVLTASGVYAALLALVTWQALRGQSLIHPDGATLGAAALILTTGTATAYAALRTAPASHSEPETEKEPTA